MLPEPLRPARHPSLARAAVSPSALVVTAAGVGVGALDHSVILAVVLGGGAWLVRMAVAAGRSRPWGRARLPNAPNIDPWAVPEPWRQFVREATAACERFDRTVAAWPDGPLRQRVAALRPRLEQSAQDVWSVARQGAALGPAPADASDLTGQLRQVQADRARLAGTGNEQDAALARREESLAAAVRARHQAGGARQAVVDRLRLLTAAMDAAVTQVVDLGLDLAADSRTEEMLSGAVASLAEELAALRDGLHQAVESHPGWPSGADSAPSPPSSPSTS